jgi:GntR family transcriptional regulator/MocR family aminotransferase
LRSCGIEQAILCDFIVDGHFGRHLRKMRDLYTERLEALFHYGDRYLSGLLRLSNAKAGLYISAFLQNGMGSSDAEARAAASGIESRALDRFTLKRRDPKGLLLGFAAFDESSIRAGTMRLAAALSGRKQPGAPGS